MKFEEVLPYLRESKKIKRAGWGHESAYIDITKLHGIYWIDLHIGVDTSIYTFTSDDLLLAKDWEIVE